MDKNCILKMVESLINLDTVECKNALKKIVNFTKEKKECEDLVKMKGHISLLKLFKTFDENLITLAAKALVNITTDKNVCNRITVCKEDLQPLFHLLNSTNEEILDLTLTILRNIITGNNNFQPSIFDYETLASLIKILDSKNRKIVSSGLFILSFIASGNNEQKQAIIDAGCLPYLTKFINSWYSEIRSESINALANICDGTPEQCERVLDVGFLPALTRFLDMLLAPLDLESLHLCKKLMYICMKSPAQGMMHSTILPLLENTFKLKISDTSIENSVEEITVEDTEDNPFSQICINIYSTDLAKCETAVLAIRNMASESIEQRQQIVDANLIPRLIELLTFTESTVCVEAAGALGNIANGTVEQSQAIIDSGAIPYLINVIGGEEDDTLKLQTALFALGNIANGTKEQKQTIIDANILPYIYILFNSIDAYIPVQVVRILVYLTSSQQLITIESTILFQLKQLLSSDNRNLCFIIACLISNLAMANDEQKQNIADSDIITSLVECLEKFSKVFFKDRETTNFEKMNDGKVFNIDLKGSTISYNDICFLLITALLNLSNTELKEVLLHANIFPILTKFLKPKYESICKNAILILINLATTKGGKKLVAANCIFPLIKLLEIHEFEDSVIRVLNHISTGEEEERELLIQADTLPSLINIIKSKNGINEAEVTTLAILDTANLTICVNAINIFGNISLGIPNGANLVSEYVPIFVKLLNSPNSGIQNASAFVLSNLSKGLPHHRKAVSDAKVIQPLITLLSNNDTFENAARVIESLTHEITVMKDIIESGAIKTFVRALESSEDNVRFFAAIILNNVSNYGEDQKQALIDAGAVPAMIKCFDYSNQNLCGALFAGLQSIISGSDNQRQFVVRSGVIPCLIKLLIFPNIIPLALNALARIAAGTNEEKEELIHAGILQHFVTNMSSSDERARNASIAGILHIAAGTSKHIDAVIQAEAIPGLVKVLTSEDSKSRKLATYAFANISEGSVEQKETIIEAIPCLIKLLENYDRETSEQAAKCLKNFVKGPNNILEKVVQEGAIPFLVSALSNDNAETSKYAEETLRFMLTSDTVNKNLLNFILEDLKKHMDEISKMNLSLFKKICEKLVAYDLVAIIKGFIENINAEIKTHASTLFQLIDEKYIRKNMLCSKTETNNNQQIIC